MNKTKHFLHAVLFFVAVGSMVVSARADYTVIDENPYRRITTYYHDDGYSFQIKRENFYGPDTLLLFITTITRDPASHLITTTDTLSDWNRRIDYYKPSPNVVSTYKEWINYGILGYRTVVGEITEYYADGKPKTAKEYFQYGYKTITLSQTTGLPVYYTLIKNSGPAAWNNVNVALTYNTNTNLLSQKVESTTLETKITVYNLNGFPTTLYISRKYGPTWTRNVTINVLEYYKNTGFLKKTYEHTAQEDKTTYYDDFYGRPTSMKIDRTYGPAAMQHSTIVYNYHTYTGELLSTTENFGTATKVINYQKGAAVNGTYTTINPAATWNLTFTTDPTSGLILSETQIIPNQSKTVTNYSNGVPSSKVFYTWTNNAWLVTLILPLTETNLPVSQTAVVTAASVKAKGFSEQKKNAGSSPQVQNDEDKLGGELPEAKLEYEPSRPIPISHDRVGVQKLLSIEEMRR